MNEAARGSSERRQARTALFLAAACLLALFCRWYWRYRLGILYFGDPRTGIPIKDAVTWALHALNLIAGRGFGDYDKGFRFESFVPPGHPAFLGLLYFYLGNHPALIEWVVAGAGSLLPLAGYFAIRGMFGRGVGLTGALLLAVYPTFAHVGFSLMSEPTAILTSIVALAAWTRLMVRPTPGLAAGAGAVFGYAALVRPSALALLVAAAPWVAARAAAPLRRRLALAAVFAAVAVMFLAGWEVRTRLVHGRAGVAYSWNSVIHSWIGSHPEYGPGFYARGIWHEVLWNDPFAAEADRMARLEAEEHEFVRQDPQRHLYSVLWRIGGLNWLVGEHGIIRRWIPGLWPSTAIVLLFPLALIGFLRALRVRTVFAGSDRPPVAMPGYVWCGTVGVALLLNVIGAGLYGATLRYRLPMEALLFPFAALGAFAIARGSRETLSDPWVVTVVDEPLPPRVRRAVRCAGAAAGLLVLVYVLGVGRAYLRPDRSAENAAAVTAEQAQSAFDRAGAGNELGAQAPRWITPAAVRQQQAANQGHVTDYRDRLVAWWGRLVFVHADAAGELVSAYLVVEPRAGDFGGARFKITRAGRGPGFAGRREDEIVTVAARLRYVPRYMGEPTLEVLAILPGRFIPPSAPSPGAPGARSP